MQCFHRSLGWWRWLSVGSMLWVSRWDGVRSVMQHLGEHQDTPDRGGRGRAGRGRRRPYSWLGAGAVGVGPGVGVVLTACAGVASADVGRADSSAPGSGTSDSPAPGSSLSRSSKPGPPGRDGGASVAARRGGAVSGSRAGRVSSGVSVATPGPARPAGSARVGNDPEDLGSSTIPSVTMEQQRRGAAAPAGAVVPSGSAVPAAQVVPQP